MDSRKKLPVQFDGDGYFITEEALSKHITTNLSELRQELLAQTDVSGKRLIAVIFVILGIVGAIASLALSGSPFYAFLIALVALVDMKAVFNFLEKSPK